MSPLSILRKYEREHEVPEEYAVMPYGEVVNKDGVEMLKLKVKTSSVSDNHIIVVGDKNSVLEDRTTESHLTRLETDVKYAMGNITAHHMDMEKVERDRGGYFNMAIDAARAFTLYKVATYRPLHNVASYFLPGLGEIINPVLEAGAEAQIEPAYEEAIDNVFDLQNRNINLETLDKIFHELPGGTDKLHKPGLLKTLDDLILDLEENFLGIRPNRKFFKAAMRFEEGIDTRADRTLLGMNDDDHSLGRNYLYAFRLHKSLTEIYEYIQTTLKRAPGTASINSLLERYTRFQTDLGLHVVDRVPVNFEHYQNLISFPARRRLQVGNIKATDLIKTAYIVGSVVYNIYNSPRFQAMLFLEKAPRPSKYEQTKHDYKRLGLLHSVLSKKDEGLNFIDGADYIYNRAAWIDQNKGTKYYNTIADFFTNPTFFDKLKRAHDQEFEALGDSRKRRLEDYSNKTLQAATRIFKTQK